MSLKSQSLNVKLIYTSLFAIAMAYLESAVVVYLRLLYYPDGFTLPLVNIPSEIWIIETGREAATIIMLLVISRFLATNSREWFAYFCINFGIWDIWYYLWLKIFLNWPANILDWDILFLIPVPWLSPVLAPVLVSASLVAAGFLILKFSWLKLNRMEWTLEIICGLIILLSFMTQSGDILNRQIPDSFPWWIFLIGWLSGIIIFTRRLFIGVNRNKDL